MQSILPAARSFLQRCSSLGLTRPCVQPLRNSSVSSFADPTALNYWHKKVKAAQLPPVVKEARIISLSNIEDPANDAVNKQIDMPEGAKLLAIGGTTEEFDLDALRSQEPNVLFVSHPLARKPLGEILRELPSIEWVHARSAGLDFVTSPELAAADVYMTNAKGQFSSTLAEYTMLACSFFAKDLPRLMKQKDAKHWGKYNVLELRRATLGIIGYGDIGRSAAKLANAYGMRVIALRRNPKKTGEDPFCKKIFGNDPDSVKELISESDYLLISAPLTEETRGMIGREELAAAKKDAVVINLGRGPIIDEDALIDALKAGNLKGAALDVFTQEPLPESSELWELPNVMLSPHNMDQTATFMHEATEFFLYENIPRFVRGEELLNHVDKSAGY